MTKSWLKFGWIALGLSCAVSVCAEAWAGPAALRAPGWPQAAKGNPAAFVRAPANQPEPPSPVLHPADPASVGMRKEPLDDIDTLVKAYVRAGRIPGAVVLVARRGAIVKEAAYGWAVAYDGFQKPARAPVAMRTDTVFDLASITKLFTAVGVMQLVERGKCRLDDPVARHMPAWAANGKERVTIRHLLTHTSGLAPYFPLHRLAGNRADRLQAVLRLPLVHPPGERYVYSDLNYIVLGALVERLSGQRLDEYVRKHITGPLGMSDTMYNPPASLKHRVAATEEQPWTRRGMVRGQVHDENAWALDGVAGHAGLFGTARDLALFAQAMLNQGRYGTRRILSPASVALMTQNQVPPSAGDAHGLGWELNQGWYMDALADSRAFGHTGFTGTSLAVNPRSRTICIVLTNRVHPTRAAPSVNPLRREVARRAALAIPVAPPGMSEAWFAGVGDVCDRTLTAAAELPAGGTLSFDTWVRVQPEDEGRVEISPDGVTWVPVACFTGESEWRRVTCQLPAGTRYVRFRYLTDEAINGRGWYVSEPRVAGPDGRQAAARWVPSGWTRERG